MQRISVVGSSGSGKTTAARVISDKLGLPHLELDGVYHQPDWEPLPTDEFHAAVSDFTTQDRWAVDGNYTSQGVQEIIWRRADTVVWLDLPKRAVTGRVTRRTVRRAVNREVLWNGNREPLTNLTSWNPEENVIRWAWTRFETTRDKYESTMNDPTWAHLDFIRLRSRKEVNAFLTTLEPNT